MGYYWYHEPKSFYLLLVIMYKYLFRNVLWAVWIFWILSLGVVNAETAITPPYGTINYILNENENFTAQVITITDWIDTITLLDRNLWATIAWTWCEDSTNMWNNPESPCANWDTTYGYYFQWGNNYGFKSTWDILSGTDKAIWDDSYSNKGYYGAIFIKSMNSPYDYWSDSSAVSPVQFNWNHYDLWWWSCYDSYSVVGDAWKVDENTVANRRWPCPEWFHVPSYGELNKMRMMVWNGTDIHNQLLIPFAGFRNYDSSVSSLGFYASLWSSRPYTNSPTWTPDSRTLGLFVPGGYQLAGGHRGSANSVRCFYDFYQSFPRPLSISFISDEKEIWTGIVMAYSIYTWIIPNVDMIKTGYVFEYRYHKYSPDTDTWFDFENEPITSRMADEYNNVYFIAKRAPKEYKIKYELHDGVISWENVTGYTIESEDITLINPTKIGYTFTWWSGTSLNFPTTTVTIPSGSTWDRNYEANWQINQYTITFDTDWWTNIPSITADYWTWITAPENPTKNGYKFIRWEPEIPTTMPAGNITVKAKWECADGYENKWWTCVKKSWWSSGWWGWGGWGWWGGSSSSCKNLPANAVANNSSKPSSNINYYYSTNTSKVCTFQCKSGYTRSAEKETCDKVSDTQTTSWKNVKEPEGTWNNTKVETWNNTEIQTWSKIDTSEKTPQDNKQDTQDSTTKNPEWKTNSTTSSTYSPEFQEAYEFAHEKWITTMSTIQKADMNGKLTRIAMAKMLSQYAINILWKTPDISNTKKFDDVSDKRNADYDNGVTLAYQLWIMWQNMPWNNFRPDDEVTRAEFATALSRMIYWTSDWVYKSTDKYYTNHMSKLVKEWIITKDDPKMKELRGYVMIMLMRSAK